MKICSEKCSLAHELFVGTFHRPAAYATLSALDQHSPEL